MSFIGSPYDRANPLVYGCWQLIEGVTIDNALLRCLRLPCHCDEGEQDGDDGFLHILAIPCYSSNLYPTVN